MKYKTILSPVATKRYIIETPEAKNYSYPERYNYQNWSNTPGKLSNSQMRDGWQQFTLFWSYITVPWFSTHGRFPILDVLSYEDAAKLQRLRNELTRGGKK